jgi:hypothetical protein
LPGGSSSAVFSFPAVLATNFTTSVARATLEIEEFLREMSLYYRFVRIPATAKISGIALEYIMLEMKLNGKQAY